MSGKLLLVSLAITGVFLCCGMQRAEAAGSETGGDETVALADGFLDPPVSARPRAFWDWLNGNVSLSQIKRDLEQAKDKGMGGLDIWDVGAIDDPKGIIPGGPAFLGPESLGAIGYTVRQATRLGLELGFISASSWNTGGAWVEPRHGTMGLYQSQITQVGPGRFSQSLPFPEVDEKCPKGGDGLPIYYKDVAVLAFPETQEKLITDASLVIDLTRRLDKDGQLTWDIPAGRWVIMRLVCTNIGQHLWVPSPNSDGLIIDHFSPEAVETHFEYIIDKLLGELGSFKGTALKYMHMDSYEVQGLMWTPKFVEEFKKRRDYDMTAYLPVLFGWTVQNKDITERFLYDFRKTLSDLIVDCHYTKAREVLNKYGLGLAAEAGGPGQPLHDCPFESLSAVGALDIMRGEFWNEHYFRDENGIDILWLVKEIACAAHIYGKKVVDMEAFTSWRHWQEGPFEYKPLADRAMCGGTNLFTFHTFPHNPPEAGRPGWAYHAGTHMGPTRVWWPMARPFIDYLSRCSYVLQQGLFVGDVCYYYGDKAPNFVKPKHMGISPGAGYDYDVTNTDVILNRMAVKNGRIVLPDGMSYELLVLPDQQDMPLTVLKKLEKMVKSGATVVGPKPTGVAGLADYRRRSKKVQKLAKKLWGPCDGEKVKEHRYGKGRIIWGRTPRQILQERGIGPDFSYTTANKQISLDYIHRRTENADIYFVRNENESMYCQTDCIFRVAGKIPELWLPDTGEMRKCPVYDFVEGGTKVPLQLAPAGSVFVVFREKAGQNHIVSVSTPFVKPGAACVEVLAAGDNNVELLAFKPGTYVLETAGGGRRIDVESVPAELEIAGPWDVCFPYGWGAPPTVVFDELISWSQHADDGVKYFSGIATYRKEFAIPAEMLGCDKQLMLDLGGVRVVADVYLNGRHLGIVWKPPFQLDISGAAKVGSNRLVVEVANVWSNRIVGDSKLPESKRYTRTNIPMAVNDRFLPLVPWEKAPLLKSGLSGPVRVISAKKIKVKLPQ